MSTDLLLILIVMSAGVYIGEYVETSVVVPKRRGEERRREGEREKGEPWGKGKDS